MKLKITKGTIIRTIMTSIVVINMILERFGLDLINTNESFIASTVEMLIEAGSIICSWWYNNSFSYAAKKADRFFMAVKEYDTTHNIKPT
ncbi:MAG: phage holin [Acutalibacteraceae bacterium]|nr:phage holin [Acutalibacteraceae bacterium]